MNKVHTFRISGRSHQHSCRLPFSLELASSLLKLRTSSLTKEKITGYDDDIESLEKRGDNQAERSAKKTSANEILPQTKTRALPSGCFSESNLK